MDVVNTFVIDDNVTEIEINNDYVENGSSVQIIIDEELKTKNISDIL